MPSGRQKAKVKSKTKPKSGVRQSKGATSTGSVQPAHKPVDYSRFDTIEVSDEDEDLHKEPDLIDSDEENDADVEEDSDGEASLQGMEGSKPDNSSQLPDTMQPSTEAREAAKTSSSSAAGKSHMPGTAKTAGLRAGFFTVGAGTAKARALGKAKRSSAQKAESGNGIVDVSNDGSEEPSTTSGGAHSGGASKARAPQNTITPSSNHSRYTKAELASLDDPDQPPILVSDEESVTRMHYSDLAFNSRPSSRGSASGRLRGKTASAAAQAAPHSSASASPFPAVPGQSVPAAAAKEADTRAASQRYTEDQLKIATALFGIVMRARQHSFNNEVMVKYALGIRLPDTKYFFALIPSSQELQPAADHQERDWQGLLEVLLKAARALVLDALARLAKLCILAGQTPIEFFRDELAAFAESAAAPRMQDPARGAPADSMSKLADSAAGAAKGVSTNGQPDFHTMVPLNKIRPDLVKLVDFMRSKLAHGNGKVWQKYKRLYDAILPGVSDVLKGAPGEAMSAAALEAVDVMLMSYRGEAFIAKQPTQTMLQFHIMHRLGGDASKIPEKTYMERFIALLEDSIKHLDDPVYPDGEESKLNRAEAEKADASKKTAAGLQSNSAEESPRDWMFRKEAEAEPGTTCLATVRAVVKMFELRKVVDFTPGAGHSQPGRQLAGIPERIMSDFIDDLIPGALAFTDSAQFAIGPWGPSIEGLEALAEHFESVMKVYREQAASENKPLSDIFDAKLHRASVLGQLDLVRQFLRGFEVATTPQGQCNEMAKFMYLKEFMPAPANATELTELGGQAMFKVLDKLFSVILESSDIDATCEAINHLLPGLEYILLQPTVFMPGWLRKPAEHVSACIASLTAEADTSGEPFPSFLQKRARRANLQMENKLAMQLIYRLAELQSALVVRKEGSAGQGPVLYKKLSTTATKTLTPKARRELLLKHDSQSGNSEPPAGQHVEQPARQPSSKASKHASAGATGAATSKEQKPADDPDDDASSCPELMSDDDPMPALPGMKPASRRFNGVEEADANTDEAGSEGMLESGSDDFVPSHAAEPPSSGEPGLYPFPGQGMYDIPHADAWPEPRLPRGVPEAEKARLREKMLKRRHEQDAKALQEKLAASEAQRREAQREEAERRAEVQRAALAQKLIEEEEAAKKKAARQAEARAKKKAKKAKQRGAKQPQKAKEPSSESEQEDKAEAEDGVSDVEDIDGNQWQEHDLAAFAGLRVSESNSSTKGPAEAKSGSKQAPAKAHGKAQTRTAIPVAQPVTSSKERVDAEAVFRGADAAFGGVPPRAVPVSSNSTAAAGAQLLPQQSRAPLAPAPEILRELDAAMSSRDVEQLEVAIQKSDVWVKRAPINRFMTQVRQNLKLAREMQKELLPTGAAPAPQAPQAAAREPVPSPSPFPAAIQELFRQKAANHDTAPRVLAKHKDWDSPPAHIPPPPPPPQAQAQRVPGAPGQQLRPPVPLQAPRTRPYQPPASLLFTAATARPRQPPQPLPSMQPPQPPPPPLPQRLSSPARHQARVEEMAQQWQATMEPPQAARAADRTVVGMQQDGGADGDDEDMCVVCWERPKEVIFLSCGHMCACRGCAADIMEEERRSFCPMCRRKISSTMLAKF